MLNHEALSRTAGIVIQRGIDMYTISDLYDLDHTLAKEYLQGFTYPWEALKGIKDMILALGPSLGPDYEEI